MVERSIIAMRFRSIPAGSSLSPLTLESTDTLLPPLGSHLRILPIGGNFVSRETNDWTVD